MIVAFKFINKHFAIIILIFIIGAYLTIKALPENSWDGWGFASAQAMLSAKQWAKEGIFKNYFLYLPQGYSKIVRYFDDPELRQHTRGLSTGGFIGKRLYYTHYPPGFNLQNALLMKTGIENRFWFRFLEISISLFALVFLYWFFNLISNNLIAILGVTYYTLSVLFLDYADALAQQPIDELRFVIIVLSVFSLRWYENKYFNYIIWALYFWIAFSSYDSTFFIFAWLVGMDFIKKKKIDWRNLFFWASAPILAFGVQIFQNYLYLGWHDMILDFYGAFKAEVVGSRKNFFISHLQRLTDPFDWFFGVKWYLGILISVLGISALKFGKKYLPENVDLRFLYLGFAVILFNFLFFPSLFFYQGRIVAIFGGLLVGILTVISVKEITLLFKTNTSTPHRGVVVFGIFILILGLWFIQGKRTYAYIKKWPNNVWPAEKIDFDKKIKNLVSGDKVIFQILGLDREVAGSDRYPMTNPEDEYYIDSPILGFTNTADLIRDFNYLKNRSEFPFSAIIITDQKSTIEKINQKLTGYKVISAEKIDDKFVVVIPKP